MCFICIPEIHTHFWATFMLKTDSISLHQTPSSEVRSCVPAVQSFADKSDGFCFIVGDRGFTVRVCVSPKPFERSLRVFIFLLFDCDLHDLCARAAGVRVRVCYGNIWTRGRDVFLKYLISDTEKVLGGMVPYTVVSV